MNIEHTHFRQAMQHTPFHDRFAAIATAEHWATWNTYKVPYVVDKLSTEYFSVRSACSVMDLTPMEKYRITGPDAYAYLDRLLTRDISKLQPGRVTYVVWCNDDGKVIDDGTLFQYGENNYMLCAQHHQLDWLHLSAAGFDVQIELQTHDIAALAVQGPTSYSVLALAGLSGLDQLKPFGILETTCNGFPVSVSRTGYTGDLGYELWVDPEHALALWDAIFAVQGQYDIHAIGLDTLEMVRIEAGFIMPGFDFNCAEATIRAGYDRSPYEIGLGWVVNLDKGHFVGRRALIEEKARPIQRRLLKLIVDGNKPVGAAYVYAGKKGKQVGEVKANTWSPILKKNLALADIDYVDGKLPSPLWARFDYERELRWHTGWAECHPQTKPFYAPEHKGLTPPNRV